MIDTPAHPVTARARIWLGWMVLGVSVALCGITSHFGGVVHSHLPAQLRAAQSDFSLTPIFTIASAIVGALIVWRRPANRIGWVCCGLGILWGVEEFVLGYYSYAVKHAQASQVVIRVRDQPGQRSFTVADDGQGADPAAARHGAGIQNMMDRMAALGGWLELSAGPGGGTTVTGQLPLAASPEAAVSAPAVTPGPAVPAGGQPAAGAARPPLPSS